MPSPSLDEGSRGFQDMRATMTRQGAGDDLPLTSPSDDLRQVGGECHGNLSGD